MYSPNEIKNKIPQLPPQDDDVRLEKIKECLIILYFSHDPPLFYEFMATKGQDSLYGQERTKKSRDKSKATSVAAENSNKYDLNISASNITNNNNNADINFDTATFDDD
ncbi:unnamed protein product [Rotaria magnacalcarata]|uniref:Uncharacterized protein n=1 Tax=Rotaria magnacalcarata TaxID=392030 RepID=A0A820ILF1_9BILA|nr:unnamed protein product [Rotaria magnacalcarata]